MRELCVCVCVGGATAVTEQTAASLHWPLPPPPSLCCSNLLTGVGEEFHKSFLHDCVYDPSYPTVTEELYCIRGKTTTYNSSQRAIGCQNLKWGVDLGGEEREREDTDKEKKKQNWKPQQKEEEEKNKRCEEKEDEGG